MEILGVKLDDLSRKEILEKVERFLDEPKFHQIATLNPEFILEAQKNKAFKDILNNCDLNIADGIGLKFASWRYGKNLKHRMTGVDLMRKILKIASDRGLSVFLAANKDGLSSWEETRDAILKIYPDLIIFGANLKCHSCFRSPRWSYGEAGSPRWSYGEAGGNDKYVLFCNFGHPYQELFINSQKNDTIRLAIGVGGSFDFLTGKIKRAPKIMRQLGLEWFWRLIQQPRRIKRIFKAVIIFPIKVIFSK